MQHLKRYKAFLITEQSNSTLVPQELYGIIEQIEARYSLMSKTVIENPNDPKDKIKVPYIVGADYDGNKIETEFKQYIKDTIGLDNWFKMPENLRCQIYAYCFQSDSGRDGIYKQKWIAGLNQAISGDKDRLKIVLKAQKDNKGNTIALDKKQSDDHMKKPEVEKAINNIKDACKDGRIKNIYDEYLKILDEQYLKSDFDDNYYYIWKMRPISIDKLLKGEAQDTVFKEWKEACKKTFTVSGIDFTFPEQSISKKGTNTGKSETIPAESSSTSSTTTKPTTTTTNQPSTNQSSSVSPSTTKITIPTGQDLKVKDVYNLKVGDVLVGTRMTGVKNDVDEGLCELKVLQKPDSKAREGSFDVKMNGQTQGLYLSWIPDNLEEPLVLGGNTETGHFVNLKIKTSTTNQSSKQNNNKEVEINTTSLKYLREKLRETFLDKSGNPKGITIDLDSVEFTIDKTKGGDCNLSYKPGETEIQNISLVYDSDSNRLNKRFEESKTKNPNSNYIEKGEGERVEKDDQGNDTNFFWKLTIITPK